MCFSNNLHHGYGYWSSLLIYTKQSTPTFKKPVLSYSATHASSASNSTGTSISYQLNNKDINTNKKKNNTSNTDDIHSCVIPRKQNYSVQATSTTTRFTPLNTTLPIAPVELHKTKQLPPAGKEYLRFQINGRSYHAAQCVKSRMMNKSIDYILYIEIFEQEIVVIKGMLQPLRLEDHMKTIGIYQSLFNRSSFEHKCLNNIKHIFQHAVKCDDQQNLKDILDASMVSNPEEVTDDSHNVPMTSTPVKKTKC